MSMRDAIDGRVVRVRKYLETPAADRATKTLERLDEEILRYPSDEEENSRNKQLEKDMAAQFRGRSGRCYFTHLLLDSRVISEIQWNDATPEQKWTTFLNSIFYVGKGKNLRPHEHLREAYDVLTASKSVDEKVREMEKKNKNIAKIVHILKIWSEGGGVIIIKAFGFIRSKEAFTREAVMIETLGFPSLCNKIRSTYHAGGVVKNLPPDQKLSFGKYLLLKAMRELTADKIPITPYTL